MNYNGPKFGWKVQFKKRRQEIKTFKNLAASASVLAQHYRGLCELFNLDKYLQERVVATSANVLAQHYRVLEVNSHLDDKYLQERVALYEKEVEIFQNEAKIWRVRNFHYNGAAQSEVMLGRAESSCGQ